MRGAIIGDVVGSRFEWHNHKSKSFELFTRQCRPTDDSVMSLAVAQALLECDGSYEGLSACATHWMQGLGRAYPHAGYGGTFVRWLEDDDPQPYHSFGNGAAMRVGPCGYAARSLNEARELAAAVTRVSHNHPEGMKAAEAVASLIWLAREGASKEELRAFVTASYYAIDFTIAQLRPIYEFDVTCQGSVPVAIEAFLEARDFEDALRTAISVGGDSDTIGAITGSIAEAYFGVPEAISAAVEPFLDARQLGILRAFEERFQA